MTNQFKMLHSQDWLRRVEIAVQKKRGPTHGANLPSATHFTSLQLDAWLWNK